MIAPTAFGVSSRDYFVYAALDEVQKAAIALLQWTEVLEGDHDDPSSDDPEGRVILASVRDDQRLRIRKLVELLVDAICFSESNEPPYYRHYLLLRDLRERRAGLYPDVVDGFENEGRRTFAVDQGRCR